MEHYNSSEELQRAQASVFAQKEVETAAKKREARKSELNANQKLVDDYIALYSNTKHVRNMAEEHKRTADYQLDLSADIVEVLEKIKSKLR